MIYPILFLLGEFTLILPAVRLPIVGSGISEVLIFAALGWLLLENTLFFKRTRAQFPLHILWIPAMLILVGGITASMVANRWLNSLSITAKIWFVMTIWVSMGIVMIRRGFLMAVLVTLVAAGCVTAALAVFDQWTGARLGTQLFSPSENFYSREPSTMGHPNALAFFLSVSLPVAVGLLVNELQNLRRRGVLVLLAAACTLSGLALFYTGSIAGWLCTGISIVLIAGFLIWRSKPKTRLALAILTIAGVAIVLIFLLLQPSIRERVSFILDYNLGRASAITGPDRLRLLDEAFGLIDKSPLIGIGLDQAGTGSTDPRGAAASDVIHNTIISGWLTGGILMFLGMVAAYAIVILTALRAIVFGVAKNNWIVLGLAVSTIAWVIFDQSQPHLYQRFTWLTVAILFGLGFGIGFVPESQSRHNTGTTSTSLTFAPSVHNE